MKIDTEAQENQGETRFAKVAECLYRHESSGTYYALVKRRGKQFRQSLKTSDRQLANRLLRDYRGEVERLTDTSGKSRITFGELAERWLETIRVKLRPASLRRRQTSLNNLAPHFKDVPVRNVTARYCEDWMVKRAEKASASTYNNERETLQAVLAYGLRDGLVLRNPAVELARKKPEKSKPVIPTREQFSKLVAALRQLDCRADDAKNLIELLAYSGMRLAEATALTWGDIDWDRDLFTVTGGDAGTKNHEARSVPLFPAMRSLLERIRGDRQPEAGERIVQIDTAKKALSTACRDAELSDFGHHAMRHYFVSNAIEAGVDFKTIASWVGHKDGGVLVAKTYGHLRDTHSFEMAKRMTLDETDSNESLIPSQVRFSAEALNPDQLATARETLQGVLQRLPRRIRTLIAGMLGEHRAMVVETGEKAAPDWVTRLDDKLVAALLPELQDWEDKNDPFVDGKVLGRGFVMLAEFQAAKNSTCPVDSAGSVLVEILMPILRAILTQAVSLPTLEMAQFFRGFGAGLSAPVEPPGRMPRFILYFCLAAFWPEVEAAASSTAVYELLEPIIGVGALGDLETFQRLYRQLGIGRGRRGRPKSAAH